MRGLRRALSGKASEETVNNILKRKRISEKAAVMAAFLMENSQKVGKVDKNGQKQVRKVDENS